MTHDTDLEKAARQALDDIRGAKLCEFNSMSSRHEMIRLMDSAITALNQALEQPAQQEPVAWITDNGRGWLRWHKPQDGDKNKNSIPLYTRPQAREPLTQDMVESCPYDGETLRGAYFEGWLKAEAKLREKNA